MKLVTSLTPDEFEDKIFGGWSMRDEYPEFFTTGVTVVKYGCHYYIVNANGVPRDTLMYKETDQAFECSTCFIANSEIQYFTIIE